MNANAPIEASNLNNPCPYFRNMNKTYTPTTTEVTWTLNLADPVIAQLRRSASNRMGDLDPSTSYDFLPSNFSRPKVFTLPTPTITYLQQLNTKPTHTTQPSPSNALLLPSPSITPTPHNHPTPSPPHQPQPTAHPPSLYTTDNRSTMDISQIHTRHQPTEDDMSQLSHLTETISVSQKSGPSPKRIRRTEPPTAVILHQPDNEQIRPAADPSTIQHNQSTTDHHTASSNSNNTTAFLNFTTVYHATPDGIRTQINQSYKAHSSTDNQITPYPEEALDSAIHFSIIPGSTTYKQAHMRINDLTMIHRIIEFFNTIEPSSHAFPSLITPPTGTSQHCVDTRPPTITSFPTNCRFTGCPHHYMGLEKPILSSTDINNLVENLQNHGYTYHSDLLHSLPSTTLNTIGWFRCPSCQYLTFTEPNLTIHLTSCNSYQQALLTQHSVQQQQHDTSHQNNHEPTVIPLPPSTRQQLNQKSHTDIPDSQLAKLFAVCPGEFIQELQTLIDANTDLPTIQQTLLGWIVETSTHATEFNKKKNE